MRKGLPDEDTVRAAVALAVRAPSVHNSQPWRWRVAESSLHLYADWTRHLDATDPDGLDLIISCGATLHHLRVALAALGWDAVVHRLPNPGDPDHLAAVELVRRPPTDDDIRLAAAIPQRRTDRRLYSSWPVPRALCDQLAEESAREGVVLQTVTSAMARYELVSAIATAAQQQRADPAYLDELARWSGRHTGSTEGVPSAAEPDVHHGYGDLRLREFAWPDLPQPRDAFAEEDAGTLLVLATPSDDMLSRLRGGEALSAVLLHATSFGLASCPLTQPLEVGQTRDMIRARVSPQHAFPQVIVRVGWAHLNADPLPPTPRRPVDDVCAHFTS
jgi:nitroreductase